MKTQKIYLTLKAYVPGDYGKFATSVFCGMYLFSEVKKICGWYLEVHKNAP